MNLCVLIILVFCYLCILVLTVLQGEIFACLLECLVIVNLTTSITVSMCRVALSLCALEANKRAVSCVFVLFIQIYYIYCHNSLHAHRVHGKYFVNTEQ